MTIHTPGPPELGLLAAASLVLRSHGFAVRSVPLMSLASQLLLAENEMFLVGVVEFSGNESLTVVESAASMALAERLDRAGAKRWDAYLVLITDAPSGDQQMSAAAADILYNTRYVRRIIRWELAPTEESLTLGLRPFFGLPDSGHSLSTTDPSKLMVDRMVAHGADPDDAVGAYERWKADDSNE